MMTAVSSPVEVENPTVEVRPVDIASASPRQTNAVNRSIGDIHTPTWLALIALNSSVRATLFHPVQLALARKRVLQETPAPSIYQVIAAARRGGVTTLPGTKTPIDFGPGGLRGLYRGYGAAFFSSLGGEATYLYALENVKQRVVLLSEGGSQTAHRSSEEDRAFYGHHWASAISAMVADLATLLIVTPIAVVVGRQMTSGVGLAANNPYRSIAGTFRHLWSLHQPRAEERLRQGTALASSSSSLTGASTELDCRRAMRQERTYPLRRAFWRSAYGVRGLYQGTSAAIVRVPSSGVWWGTYTASKEGLYSTFSPILHRWQQERHPESTLTWKQNWFLSPTDNPLLNATASAIASIITTVIVNPVAVIQIRLQSLPAVGPGSAATVASAENRKGGIIRQVYRPNSFLGVAADIMRKEGMRGFFKGTTTNVGISVVDGIVFAIMFELTKLGSDYGFLAHFKSDITESEDERKERACYSDTWTY